MLLAKAPYGGHFLGSSMTRIPSGPAAASSVPSSFTTSRSGVKRGGVVGNSVCNKHGLIKTLLEGNNDDDDKNCFLDHLLPIFCACSFFFSVVKPALSPLLILTLFFDEEAEKRFGSREK